MLNYPEVGYLVFERLTFQVFDTPDLKITVYTPLEEEDTPRKVELLLEQWYQLEARGQFTPQEVLQTGEDTVGLWLAACCKRVDGGWIANRTIMASYTNWCAAHGCAPKTAKGISQSLAVHGLEIAVNKRVVDAQHRQKMARGVRGLVIL